MAQLIGLGPRALEGAPVAFQERSDRDKDFVSFRCNDSRQHMHDEQWFAETRFSPSFLFSYCNRITASRVITIRIFEEDREQAKKVTQKCTVVSQDHGAPADGNWIGSVG